MARPLYPSADSRPDTPAPPPARPPARPPIGARAVIGALAFGLVYFLLVRLSLVVYQASGNHAALWPQSGLALGILLLSPVRRWPAILAIVLAADSIATISMGSPVRLSLGLAAVNCLEAGAGAGLVRRFVRGPVRLDGLGQVVAFLGLAVVGVNTLTSIPGALLLDAAYHGGQAFQRQWLEWFAGDGVGMLVVAPVVLTFAGARAIGQQPFTFRSGCEAALVAVGLASVAQVVFGTPPGDAASQFVEVRPYLVFPLLFWGAVRFGPRGAAGASLLLTVVAVWNTVAGRGPMVSQTQPQQVSMLEMQTFLAVAATSALLLAAIITQGAAAAAALNESESRFRQLVEASADWVWVVDERFRYIYTSPKVRDILGHEPADILGRTPFDFMPPEESLRVRAFFDDAARPRAFTMLEHVLLHVAGHRVVVETSGVPYYDGQGRFRGYRGIDRDITDRKHAEARQAFMVRELDHRVKNNLAAVMSLADHTSATAASLKHFREAFMGRLGALARAHTLLARTGWSGMRLRQLVEQSLGAFLGAGGARILIEGPDTELPTKVAAPLCMALHELVTNAAKYGSLSVSDGQVRLSWTLEGRSGETRRLFLRWQESGGPTVSPPLSTGFGTTLIRDTIGHDLGGRVEMQYLPAGLVCTIELDLHFAPETQTPTPVADLFRDGTGSAGSRSRLFSPTPAPPPTPASAKDGEAGVGGGVTA
jgi:PAS domain S-box-containing protein